MTDLGLPNLTIRISFNKREGDDGEKGNNNKLESKKRGFDDFKIDAGKEIKRRRRMEHRRDCDRVLLAPPPRTMIHRDCQNKQPPKSRESSEPRNLRRGRDCLPPLHEEKQSCRPTTAAIDQHAHQFSPTKALRVAQIKKRYAHLIFKANHHQGLVPLNQGDIADHLKQQQETKRLEIAEKARIEQEIKAAQTLLLMRAEADLKIKREAARIALENMKKTVEFNDACQIMRDFESLLNSHC